MNIIAEQQLDLRDSEAKVVVRLFAPEQKGQDLWVCRHEIGEPIGEMLETEGVTSLQALALAVKGLSAALYSHPLYREGRLGAFGEFGDYLGLPAPAQYQRFAPFPF
jgi:hypothetical protein